MANVYPHPEPQFVNFASRRSVIHSTKGIVSCTQPLASAAGIEVLRKGGNAAVLISSVLPHKSQLTHVRMLPSPWQLPSMSWNLAPPA